MKQKRNCIGRRYISIFDLWSMVNPRCSYRSSLFAVIYDKKNGP
jgi:hypothetical protein